MKAMVYNGDFEVVPREIEIPQISGREVLVQVLAVGVCATDLAIISGKFAYAEPPCVLGHEISGRIVRTGEGCRKRKVGDRVVIETSIGCGKCRFCESGQRHLCPNMTEIGYPPHQGGYAQYLKCPEDNAVPIPDSMSFAEAGILESIVCPIGALWNRIRMGDRVAVIGNGPAAIGFIQGARALGAGKILTIGRNKEHIERTLRFGADESLLSTLPDLKEKVYELFGGEGPDIVCEATGVSSMMDLAMELVRIGGRIICYGIPEGEDRADLSVKDIILKQITVQGAVGNTLVWDPLLKLIEKGAIDLKSMVTEEMDLERLVDALRKMADPKDKPIKIVLRPFGIPVKKEDR